MAMSDAINTLRNRHGEGSFFLYKRSTLLIVFYEGCDFSLLRTERTCLKYVRTGNKVLGLGVRGKVKVSSDAFQVL
jgi:hypothetical protein